jgi:hypothetical protein
LARQNGAGFSHSQPSADEIALLEPFRGKVPDEVFGKPYVPPIGHKATTHWIANTNENDRYTSRNWLKYR